MKKHVVFKKVILQSLAVADCDSESQASSPDVTGCILAHPPKIRRAAYQVEDETKTF